MGETRDDELAVIEPQAPLALFGTNDPVQVIATAARVATALAEVVNERKLYAIVNNKKFPTVEAWTLLGSMLGVFPILEWSRPLVNDDGSVRGYEARVIAKTLSGRTVGAGEAMCVKGESKTWHANAQEFAVRSMAQTRATSKALRGPLDFVFKLAGFQPTPAEEMTDERPAVDSDGVITNPSAESLKAAQTGVPASPSSGPAPIAPPPDGQAEASKPSAGPRAKRGNVVQAPQAAEKPATAPQATQAAPVEQDRPGQRLAAPAPLRTEPPAPVALAEPEDGKTEYLATLRQQAREAAASLRQLRVRMLNAEKASEIALGNAQAIPVPEAKPGTDSDESLAKFVADTFPGKTLDALNAGELEKITTTLDALIVRVEAKLKS
jgi:hypothetical protein